MIKMAKTVRSRKAKGRTFQKETARKIRETFNLSDHEAISSAASVPGEDIIFTPYAREQFPFSVECKNQEHIQIWDAIAQSEKNAGEYVPIVVFKRNNMEPQVVINFDDFLVLVKYGVSGVRRALHN